MNYNEFIKQKQVNTITAGFNISANDINEYLFDWQKAITKWAIGKGRCAIFADCGLGKTMLQLEWADKIAKHTNKPVLIIAPLAVSKQTKREALKLGIVINLCANAADVLSGINITNYEKLENFDGAQFGGVVLDESSILKSFSGSTKQMLIDKFKKTQYKLCCTATPSPNDFMELGNHAEFLGIMSRSEMLATYFVHDTGDTAKWRLKGHAELKFWEWLATWAVVIKTPADIGFDATGYELPPLNIVTHILDSRPEDAVGQLSLFNKVAQTLNERRDARRNSIDSRVAKASELTNNSVDNWLIWCDYNNESEALKNQINKAIEVKGSDSPEHKENSVINFADGKIKALVTKPSICGFGINWQVCSNMVFCGLSDSYEQFYQAVRRCWRFGQTKPVNVHIIISEAETAVLENIKRKEADAQRMTAEMIKLTKNTIINELFGSVKISEEYNARNVLQVPSWLKSEAA